MFWALLYQIGYICAVTLPLKTGYRIAQLLADLQYAFSKKDRICVIENLKVILQKDNPKEIEMYAREVFRNFGKYLIDFFRISKIDKDFINKNVKIEGLQNLQSALNKGKGVLATSAHIGNWELGAIALSILGYHVNIIALDHTVKWINNFFIKQRTSKGINVISPRFALKRCLTVLHNNELIGILGDREFYNQAVEMDFLGKASFIPKGPALISLKTGSPILPCFMIRQPDDTFNFIFEPAIEYTPSDNKENDIKILTKKYITIIEKYIREFPSQWFIFQAFWKKPQNTEVI